MFIKIYFLFIIFNFILGAFPIKNFHFLFPFILYFSVILTHDINLNEVIISVSQIERYFQETFESFLFGLLRETSF